MFNGGSGRKTDGTDAYAIALAALGATDLRPVRQDDGVTILRILIDRRQQLVQARIATVNRLHDLLQQLVSGGVARQLSPTKARALLDTITSTSEA